MSFLTMVVKSRISPTIPSISNRVPKFKRNPYLCIMSKLFKWTGGRQEKCLYRKMLLMQFRIFKFGFDSYMLDYEPNQILPAHVDEVGNGKHYRINIGWGKCKFIIKKTIFSLCKGKFSLHLFRPDINRHSLVINGHTRKLSIGFVKYL